MTRDQTLTAAQGCGRQIFPHEFGPCPHCALCASPQARAATLQVPRKRACLAILQDDTQKTFVDVPRLMLAATDLGTARREGGGPHHDTSICNAN